MTNKAQSIETVVTRSADETFAWGRQFAARLRAGDVVALSGELGAGKTRLAQGLAAGLGVTAPVTSPSFTFIHEYQGRCPVFHIDLYRLETEAQALDIGVSEYFGGEGICIVEWAEKIPALLPQDAWWLEIEIVTQQERKITVRRQLRDEACT